MRSCSALRMLCLLGLPCVAAVAAASTARSAHAAECGDGLLDPGETCDDGNLDDDDGCDATCEPSGIATLSHGDGTACAVTWAGNVKCWGLNDAGQLGQGDHEDRGDDEKVAEVAFVELSGPAASVSTNGHQSFALMVDGTVRAWGLNDQYQLGLRHQETIGDDEKPSTASGPVTPVLGGRAVELSAQGYFACVRLEGGAVRCWGANDTGQLGYGHTETIGDDEDPADAGDLRLFGAAVGLATGANHGCALLDGGGVQCWGANDAGQLGLGHTETIGDDEPPTAGGVVDLGGRMVQQIVAGADHTCALFLDGGVRCWGANSYGQLGHTDEDSVGDDETPAALGDVALPGVAVSITAGAAHTCAAIADGTLYCWGANDLGQLGRETEGVTGTLDISAPVDLEGMAVVELFPGSLGEKTCARLEGELVRCWGANDIGQLGTGDTDTAAADGSGDQFVVVVDETIQ